MITLVRALNLCHNDAWTRFVARRQKHMTKKIEFAPVLSVEAFPPAFVADFSRRILGLEWDEIVFVSDESSVMDFSQSGREETLATIQREYGVDCSDIKFLNLGEVLRRCADRSGALPD